MAKRTPKVRLLRAALQYFRVEAVDITTFLSVAGDGGADGSLTQRGIRGAMANYRNHAKGNADEMAKRGAIDLHTLIDYACGTKPIPDLPESPAAPAEDLEDRSNGDSKMHDGDLT